MKVSIVLFVAFSMFTVVGQASWFQESCYSTGGIVETHQGHEKNFVVVTRKGKRGKRKIRFDLSRVSINYVDHKDIKATSSIGACAPGQQYTTTEWTQIFYREVKIWKNNGTAFPRGTQGTLNGGTIVHAHTICEQKGHSQSPCP